MDVAALIKEARRTARLSQLEMAARAGTQQAVVCGYERGTRVPSLDMLRRLLAAAGVQMRVELEPLWAEVDRAIDVAAGQSMEERLADLPVDICQLERNFAAVPLPHVIDGLIAGVLQGAPVPVDAIDITVAETDLDALAQALQAIYAQRWCPRWRQFGLAVSDPREEGEPRWRTYCGEVRVQMLPELPASITVMVNTLEMPVRPLPDVEVSNERAARVLDRLRTRLASTA